MQEKKTETPNWNPPQPPWNPEPEPMSLRGKEEADPDPEEEPEPVNMGLEDKVEEMVESGELKMDSEEPVAEVTPQSYEVDPPGLNTYTVICPTGITINGKVFAAGPHLVDEDTYETLSTLDAPYQ